MVERVSERTIKALEGLGLTEYEIKAYLSLLESGSLTAAEVSKHSGVPYSKVYEVLRRLEDKGWVESDKGRPAKYYSRDPKLALNSLKMKLEDEWKSAESLILSELGPIYEGREVKERPEIWIVKGEFNIISKIMEVLRATKDELKIALPKEVGGMFKKGIYLLKMLDAKGVKIRVLTSSDQDGMTIKKALPASEVRKKEGMFGGGMISDGKRVVLLLGSKEKGSPFLAIWAEHPGLAMFASSYFDYIWGSGEWIR
jgi:sugar-specific transcriptional regulator TrmB